MNAHERVWGLGGPQSIVVRCPNWVGDAVMATPALRALRRRFPDARIDLAGAERIRQVVEPGPFHQGFVVLTGRVLRDARALRRGGYDLGVLLANSFRSALALRLAGVPRRLGYDRDGRHLLLTDRVPPVRDGRRFLPAPVLDSYLALVAALGCPTDDRRMELAVSPADEQAAEQLLAASGSRSDLSDPSDPSDAGRTRNPKPETRLVVLTPGAAFGSAKLWPAERFAEVGDHLAERLSALVVVAAAPEEAAVAQAVVAAMKHRAVNLAERRASLGVLKSVVRRAAILVTNDSGPRHFAAAFDRPVVTVFGPTDPRWSETHHPKEVCLLPHCDCAPCQLRTCPRDHRCITGITAQMAIAACDSLLDRFGRHDGV